MDPAKKKWLNNLIEHISNTFEFAPQDNAYIFQQNLSSDDFLYKLLHSTGIVFGYPEQSFFKVHPLAYEWNETDKAKVFFAESLIDCYINYYGLDSSLSLSAETCTAVLIEAVESIAAFYSLYKPEKNRPHLIEISKIFRSDSSTISKVEKIIGHRIKPAKIFDSKYWQGSQYDIFIFLDVIFYSDWLNNGESELYKQDSLIQKELLNVIAVSIANSSGTNRKVEHGFLNFFLENAIEKNKLTKAYANKSRELLINSIVKNTNWPLVINTILFEYSIFTFMLDKTIDQKEDTLVNQIANQLVIGSEQKEISLLVVSSFIFKNLDKISYIKSHDAFDIISSNLNRKFSSIIIKNKGKISREIGESRELAELLWKAKNTNLTDEERKKVKHQLIDIFLRTIPSLAVFMIPGGSILLPILLKVLPEEVLMPSSFRNK